MLSHSRGSTLIALTRQSVEMSKSASVANPKVFPESLGVFLLNLRFSKGLWIARNGLTFLRFFGFEVYAS